MSTVCVKCAKKRFTVSLFMVYGLCAYLYIVNVLITMCMLFSESLWHLREAIVLLFYIKQCVVYIVYISLLVFVTIISAFLWLWKAWKGLSSYLYVCNTISIASNVTHNPNPFTAFCTYVWACRWFLLINTWTVENYGPSCDPPPPLLQWHDQQVSLQMEIYSMKHLIDAGILMK